MELEHKIPVTYCFVPAEVKADSEQSVGREYNGRPPVQLDQSLLPYGRTVVMYDADAACDIFETLRI